MHHIKTISEYHQMAGLPLPDHPHISVINLETLRGTEIKEPIKLMCDFYWISLKAHENGRFQYTYGSHATIPHKLKEGGDFEASTLFFMSPGQVFGIAPLGKRLSKMSGWFILIHPDFLWRTKLAKTIKQYGFFDYSANEALHLAPKEEKKIVSIIKNIQQEYKTNIDAFSQNIIVAELELLFTYAERFYNRQFITRKITHSGVLEKLEDLLNDYVDSNKLATEGLPTVQYISESLHISPNYLRGLLKSLTGLNTQEHIHKVIIEKAKEKLSTTELSISEIAYELGFEHPASFSKLFKSKTRQSPLEFRASFN
ncbi:helix-turn-helix domain-containing protein [Dinghuibacter silviterrae]|nr:helix-turn-helix transcriptional regulator [Dinghuibacter silviterrae]